MTDMEQFFYKSVTKDGIHSSGQIEASDRKAAVSVLTARGEFVIELGQKLQGTTLQARERFRFAETMPAKTTIIHRINSKDILSFTNQLSSALRAGLPLLTTLEIIRDQQTKPQMKQLLDELAESVRSGRSLSESMSSYPRQFSVLYISMIKVGETGGILEQTTTQLTSLLAREEKVKTSLKNASAYPIFVLSLGLVSAVIVVTWILPKILSTISGGTGILPLPTRILLGSSDFLKALATTVGGWMLMALIIAAISYMVRWTRGNGRNSWDSFKLKIPVLGTVLQTIAVGRFAKTLGSLTKGGVTIIESLTVVRDTLGNEFLGREIDKVTEKVKTGASLAESLEQSGYFPPLLIQITAVGEQTGKLDELLLNAADTFEEQADSAMNRFIAIFPAVLILLLALVVGFIIAATLLPIIQMELGAAM
jgi:type II secretory pathway component PulF